MKKLYTIVFAFILFQASAQTYREEEVQFTNEDTQLSGTLSFPEGDQKSYGAIILVSGSGPQNRDSDILGFKPFKLLADYFNSQGWAVLRYDDRGFGKSTGKSVNESTTADLAMDATEAYRYLKSRPDINKSKIGLLGHSEGGVIVPIVANKEPDVAFLILKAGFGVKGSEVSTVQQKAVLRSSGMSEEFVEASSTMNQKVLAMMSDDSVSEEELSTFVKAETLKLLEFLPEETLKQIPDRNAYAEMGAKQAVGQSKVPWLKYYMSYDPYPALTKVKCPVLILFGELDTQVLASQNLEPMENALKEGGNKDFKTVIIPKANHLFQEAVTGSPGEYGSLKKEFAPGFLSTMGEWLNSRF